MRRPRPRLVIGLGIPLLVVIVLLAAWAIDLSGTSGKVARNVTLAGVDIGTLDQEALAARVAQVAQRYEATEVQLRTQERTYRERASDLGLQLDQDATVQAALDVGRGTALPLRPFAWVASFAQKRQAPLVFRVDPAKLDEALTKVKGTTPPTEPRLVAGSQGMTVISGQPGVEVDPAGVRQQLLRVADRGELPFVVDLNLTPQAPRVDDADAQTLAAKLTAATAAGLTVRAGQATTTLPPATVRAWLGSSVADDAITPTLDKTRALADLRTALPGQIEAADASITLAGSTVVIRPSRDGSRCCADDTPDRLLAAIVGGSGAVDVDLAVTKAAFTTEQARALGIKEPVGGVTVWKGQPQVKSFTTYYPCCAPRVTNIHRIADLIRGTLVLPGQTFSVNRTVGQRTSGKGFVVAGAIANGEHVDEVGGGVSQFATTMFNAAFFAGLPFVEYQAHSEHFDRYPYGREATMGYPHPDLAWKNNTPHGILIWTSYTDTSVTVTLWSTQFASAQQTGQTTSRSGNCTIVRTERTITYAAGGTAKDTVGARYRDPGKTRC